MCVFCVKIKCSPKKIRKYLIDNNFVDFIIQLPSNLFFGTPIATCILVLKRGKADNKTLFIDATKECIKVTNNNKLTPDNINRIVEEYTSKADVEHLISEIQEIRASERRFYQKITDIYATSVDYSLDIVREISFSTACFSLRLYKNHIYS